MNNNLLHKNQLGFQINNLSEHAILQFTRDIAQNFDNDKFTLGVFIDPSKTFHTVDHQILFKLTYLLTYLLTYFFTYLLTYLLTHSLTYLLTYLLTQKIKTL